MRDAVIVLKKLRTLGSAALTIVCVGASSNVVHAQSPVPSIVSRVRIDPERPIDFHATVSPETVFVGQQATYQVGVFLDEVARMRIRRNPEFLPPELRGLLSYELGTPTPEPPRTVGSKHYASHVFLRGLFPIASGSLAIPPAQLTYALPQTSSYFSREDTYVVKAESTSLIVKPLPDEGKPDGFTGAVGVLKATARFDANSVRVGDPIVFTLRIYGAGNVKLLPRPTLEVEWASAVAASERLAVDTSGQVVRGAKEFDWILTPARAGDVITPEIQYSFFNPYAAKYQVAVAAPVALAVKTGTLADSESADEPPTLLPLRERDEGTVAPLVTDNSLFWLLLIAMPLPALLLLREPTEKKVKRTSPVDALQLISRRSGRSPTVSDVHAKIAASPESTMGAARRAFLAALAQRLAVHPDLLTDRAQLERTLRRRGVTDEVTSEVLTLLQRFDDAAFAPRSNATADAATRAHSAIDNALVGTLANEAVDLYRQVDEEALHASIAPLPEGRRRTLTFRSTIAVAALGTGAAILASATTHDLHAQMQQAGDPFTTASDSYNRHMFREAADLFHTVVIATPRNASALTNWGTAAWAAGDTVSAVVAWQRAARLEPLAEDLQQRIALLPAGARGGIAEVPLIPVNILAIGGATFWCAGWLTLAIVGWRNRRKWATRPWVKVWGIVVIMIGAGMASVAAWGTRSLSTYRLAVVLRPETMRTSPDGDADAVGGAATGDVVRFDIHDASWTHVNHSDGRTGWLPTQRLVTLTEDPAPR